MTLRAAELDDVAREIGRMLDGRPGAMIVQRVVQPDDVTVMLSKGVLPKLGAVISRL